MINNCLFIVTSFIALLYGCSHADWAQVSDSATLSIALDRGFQEANPVFSGMSGPMIAASKIALTQAVKFTPLSICEPGLVGLTVAGYGGALWNIGVMAGSGIAALPVVLALTVWQWDTWRHDALYTCVNPTEWRLPLMESGWNQ